MARPQNRKRQRADEPSRGDTEPSTKKIKTRSEIELDAWASWEYPPEFWDRLSNISLSHRALRELNRRTRAPHRHPSPPASPSGLVLSRTTTSPSLSRFARHGGPDLLDLSGYPHPPIDHQSLIAMSASQSSRSRRTRSTDPASTLPTSATTKTKKSTPYNRDFDLHLTEHLVHPVYSSQEPDLGEVMAAMAVPRPSLSPSKFSGDAFRAFRESDARAKDEDDVLANVIPTILGPSHSSHYCSRNTVFANLEPLTDDTIVAAKPDIYYGAYPEQLVRPARNELASHIVPSTMEDKPMAPNFFLEAKGPDGHAAVATRQARYDGAIGSRAMHSLQNYGAEEPEYDGKPYTLSSVYHDGHLKMYAHHVTAPNEEGRPEYHMTQLDTWGMIGNIDSFRRGATALRNARDLAKQHRDNFIQAANARATEEIADHQSRGTTATAIRYGDSPDELAPSPHHYTAEVRREDSPDELALSRPHYLYEGYGSQDASQESAAPGLDPLASFATSFTTSFTSSSSHRTHPKRQRSQRSGPQVDEAPKSRTRRKRVADLAMPATEATRADATEFLWVETYWRNGKLCFKNMRDQEVKTEVNNWLGQILDDGTESFYWQNPKSGRVFWTRVLATKPKKK
ncbi:hypothetical protein QQS21_004968 [Conoideocrella luteorostrata]|uniref:DUF7924 domain-containing protein n=1 Tax=Conoideocrella luteorostrata TaxID=1105319 RepID=A0AAJ0CQN0_9HYPO|nr:hypothetical protein QQS21_004968 [Conoideocrella luteorostrata]